MPEVMVVKVVWVTGLVGLEAVDEHALVLQNPLLGEDPEEVEGMVLVPVTDVDAAPEDD